MSQTPSRNISTPSVQTKPSPFVPSFPAHFDPSVAVNAQSSHPTSSNVLSNKLIPRDYLALRSKTSPAYGVNNSHSIPLVSESFGPESDTSRSQTESRQQFGRPPRKESLKTSGRDQTRSNEGDETERTQSPESILTTQSGDSASVTSRTTTGGCSSRSLHTDMPRTSSIDSAISSVSTTSQLRKDVSDGRDPSPGSVRGLIAAAGSAETLVLHLLKEKKNAINQNNQLWKLVEKQRVLLIGLNKDLERVTKDRDRYKKKVKEAHIQSEIPGLNIRHENAVQPPAQSSTIQIENDPLLDEPGPAIEENTTSNHPAPLSLHTHNLAQPTLSITQPTPLTEKSGKGFSSLRKGAPKPLNLLRNGGNQEEEEEEESIINAADRSFLASDDEDEPRGRRKTRAEDDQDREKSLKAEQEARSKSATAKIQPIPSNEAISTMPPPTVNVPLPSSPRPPPLAQDSLFVQGQGQKVTLPDRLIPMGLRSPGLPSSPRPMNPSQLSALPMSPRAPPVGPGPLSPRAPKQHVPPPMMSPSPFTDPAVIQRQNAIARQAAQESLQPSDRLQVHDPASSNEIPSVYQGLVSPQYPNLLLPPNALPSIQVKVASSRLRPSRHSMLGLRTQDDSTVFSLSIYSRASRNELWRLEKIPATLPQLDQQLRPYCKDLPRIPDRKFFVGHSPAMIDTRRQIIDAYFDDLFDVELDENSALIICRFLSTDVLDPDTEVPKRPGVNTESLPQMTSLSGKVVKTGYLTKRGKNFGGWKSRYFVIDSPELKYYETPGGAHLGTIRIHRAKIGSQRAEEAAGMEEDDQYRHAFLVQEPKKKDSSTFVRHVLCAESDADRDEWVAALLHYVEATDTPQSPNLTIFPPQSSTSNGREKTTEAHSNSSGTPTTPTWTTFVEAVSPDPNSKTNISGPINGAPIQDSSHWGNKQIAQPKDRSKMGNIFNFRNNSQEQPPPRPREESASRPRVLRHNGYVRAVFGLPLAEAVEFCSPFNVDVSLPAVVYRSIEYLRFRNAANEEGLFRLSGSNIVIKSLRERFNTEGDIDLVDDEEHYDVHAVASLFKSYLRELPFPILTRDLHIEFLKVLELDNVEDKIVAYNHLVHKLPPVNFALLRALSEYLLEVTENANKNKMSVRNMGIVFSPTLNIPTPVFNFFLSEFSAIFDQSANQLISGAQPSQITAYSTNNLAPTDVRSPRHQMFSDLPTPAYNQTTFSSDPRPSIKSNPHQQAGSGEFGFIPVQPSYESGQYVSHPQEQRAMAYAPPSSHITQLEGEEQYGSLNRMLVPPGAISDKRRKRESAMLF